MTRGADAASPAPAARPRLGLIWAESAGVIGRDGGMPWHVPEDLTHFKAVTLGAPVVMGRRTWESLPSRFRPLPGRTNIVVTHHDDWTAAGAVRAASVDEALALAAAGDPPWIWVIGGADLFGQVLPTADRLEVTELRTPGGGGAVVPEPGDTPAPPIDPAGWRLAHVDPPSGWLPSRSGLEYRFLRYLRA
ncbi:dihydrofolate reductase [Agromyces ramosus]|uniref:Dihydrofolate reductase n=1 Tax=Agromyces ramosus TaxID=33879 RepID=A0A4Q7MJ89_9MICO|nr:dihydrofolate reductase [Agromyces ramosus]RZS67643.1 dihydrofolate reductase [Agromyces ramosus]